MVFKNLFRRKGRTLLTVLGISIGVSSIVTLGALADGLEAGYSSVLSGTTADFVLSDPESFDIIMSALDENIGEQLATMPEVEAVSPLLQGLVQTEETPYFFVFGYPGDSFALERFQVTEGVSIYSREAGLLRGTPLMLGSSAAESMNKEVGDTLRVGDGVYRVVGIYQTGDAFEEGGAVMRLEDAQQLLGMQRQVSIFYIQIKEPALADRLRTRVERLFPDLTLSTGEELSKRTAMTESLRAVVWGVAALAILIGGVGMTNAQLMSVYERTREIGVLRAVGWRASRVLLMILGESVVVSLLGGIVGIGLSYLMLLGAQDVFGALGATTASVKSSLIVQAFSVVIVLGIVGGLYPAFRASRLEPVEALRYEGGSAGDAASRLPIGGMPVQNLWRRKARTLLTLVVLSITIGSVAVLNSIMDGSSQMLNAFVGGAEIIVRQRDAADTGVAFIDERIGDQIALIPGVENVSGTIFTATMSDQVGIFLLMGYSPREAAISRYQIVEGDRISTNRQIMVGRSIAEAQSLQVGDTVTLGAMRFKVVGIYESSTAWEELGGIVTLRDAQTFSGRQRKVTFFTIDLYDPNQAEDISAQINEQFPEVAASLAGDFASELPDMQNSYVMTNTVVVMAVIVGGVGMMNAMLMAVLERTREIGVLRALGWRRRRILNLIMRESLALGILGAVVGVGIALGMAWSLAQIPSYGEMLVFSWDARVFEQIIGVALVLGLVGGLYPALRATRMQPVEALRYE